MIKQAALPICQRILFLTITYGLIAPAFADTRPAVATQMAPAAQTENVHFLALADIHFDPFLSCANQKPCPLIEKMRKSPSSQWSGLLAQYDSQPPQYRFDTNYSLLSSALTASKNAATEKQAMFVVVLGDFIGHDYRHYYKTYSSDKTLDGYQAFVRKTLEFLTGELAASFPNLDVYSVVGNNDSYQDDYVTNPEGQFFRDTAMLWSRLIKNNDNRLQMQKKFVTAGYYAVTLPGEPGIRLIILNTNLFSYKAQGRLINKTAINELNWLHDQLQSARQNQQKVFIAMHIPEGIDVYATLRLRLFRLVTLWKSVYVDRFQSELEQFAPEILGVIAGHLHSDWLQMLSFNNADEIPVTGVPSISPIFGNNPGFKIYSYQQNPQQLHDSATYYYPLSGNRRWNADIDQLLTDSSASYPQK